MDNSFIEKIVKEKGFDGKLWVHVYFDNGTIWIPALWEEAYIAQLVVACERTKYPTLPWDAGEMTIEFITRAMMGQNIEGLCHDNDSRGREFGLYKLPSYLRLATVLKNSRNHNG